MRFYISDMHFYHERLIKMFDNRPFESVEQMNAHMISQWNKKVKPNDEVVILGDFSYEKGEKTNEILKALNGRLYLVTGNHDFFVDDPDFDKNRFVWIKPYAEMKDNGRKVVLSHYPIFTYNGQFRVNEKGEYTTYMLYGHVHNSYDEMVTHRFIRELSETKRYYNNSPEKIAYPCQMINCFSMFSDYTPLSLDEWIELDADRRAKIDRGEIVIE